MRRRELLTGLVAARLWGQAPLNLNLHRLSNKLFAVTGNGGNMLAAVSGEGILLIDSGLAEKGAKLQQELSERIVQAPVRLVINTHWHADHTGGNVALGKAAAAIAAHPNTREHLRHAHTSKPGLPRQLIQKPQRLMLGAIAADVTPHPPAHTDGDLSVFFPNENVLYTGDLFTARRFPVIDATTGGWLGGMVEASDALLRTGDEKTAIVPGHGPVCERQDLRQFRDMLEVVWDRLTKLGDAGVGVQEAVARRPLADLEGSWGGDTAAGDFARIAYTSLLQHRQTGGSRNSIGTK